MFEVFQGLFFPFLLLRKDALETRLALNLFSYIKVIFLFLKYFNITQFKQAFDPSNITKSFFAIKEIMKC